MLSERNHVFCDPSWVRTVVDHGSSVERTHYYPRSNGDVFVEVVYTNGTWKSFYYKRLPVAKPDQVPDWCTYDWTLHKWSGFEKFPLHENGRCKSFDTTIKCYLNMDGLNVLPFLCSSGCMEGGLGSSSWRWGGNYQQEF